MTRQSLLRSMMSFSGATLISRGEGFGGSLEVKTGIGNRESGMGDRTAQRAVVRFLVTGNRFPVPIFPEIDAPRRTP